MITNKLNLPLPLYKAICGDTYSAGSSDISTTSLSVPSRIWALRKLYGDKITTDAADRIYSLIGQVGHGICERLSNDPDFIAEQRFYMDVDGTKIGGQIDLYQKSTCTLYDYKVCSYWVSKEGVKPEWKQQANVNALLLRRAGLPVYRAVYIAIFRDWSKPKAGLGDTPELPVMSFEVALQPEQMTLDWIKARIKSHKDAIKYLPECTAEERWSKPDQWAVMKKGQKKAIKLHDEFDVAQRHQGMLSDVAGKKYYIEKRPGESTRCKFYCECAPFCEQFKKMQEAAQ